MKPQSFSQFASIDTSRDEYNCHHIIGICMKKIMTLLTLLLAQNIYAIELEGINGVEILAINGKEVETRFFSSDDEIKPGYHQIVLRYSKDFDDDNNKKSVRTLPVILNLDIQEDTQITVPDYNQPYKAERAIKKGLTFQVVSAKKQYDIVETPLLTKKGYSIFSDVEKLIETYNKENNITIAVQEDIITIPATVVGTRTAPIETTVGSEGTILEQIKLYQKSTPAQKKAFRLWLLEQDLK